jgi:hypothetical protein
LAQFFGTSINDYKKVHNFRIVLLGKRETFFYSMTIFFDKMADGMQGARIQIH